MAKSEQDGKRVLDEWGKNASPEAEIVNHEDYDAARHDESPAGPKAEPAKPVPPDAAEQLAHLPPEERRGVRAILDDWTESKKQKLRAWRIKWKDQNRNDILFRYERAKDIAADLDGKSKKERGSISLALSALTGASVEMLEYDRRVSAGYDKEEIEKIAEMGVAVTWAHLNVLRNKDKKAREEKLALVCKESLSAAKLAMTFRTPVEPKKPHQEVVALLQRAAKLSAESGAHNEEMVKALESLWTAMQCPLLGKDRIEAAASKRSKADAPGAPTSPEAQVPVCHVPVVDAGSGKSICPSATDNGGNIQQPPDPATADTDPPTESPTKRGTLSPTSAKPSAGSKKSARDVLTSLEGLVVHLAEGQRRKALACIAQMVTRGGDTVERDKLRTSLEDLRLDSAAVEELVSTLPTRAFPKAYAALSANYSGSFKKRLKSVAGTHHVDRNALALLADWWLPPEAEQRRAGRRS